MKNALRIGIITHNFPANKKDRQNAGIFVYDLAQELAKRNQVFVYCPASKGEKVKMGRVNVWFYGWKEGAKLGSLKLWNPFEILNLFTFFTKGFGKLEQWYRDTKPDVIVAMWSFPAGLFAYRLKKRFGIPYATWSLGSDIYIYAKKPFAKQLIQKILQEANWLFADGIDLAKQVETLSGEKCIFLPSASKIDTSPRSSTTKSKDRLHLIIAFVGRLETVKGPDILIDALIKLKNKINYQANIIGGGSLLEDLQKKVKDVGLDKKVTFYGNVSDKAKIVSILQASDWLVIPDRSGSIPLVFSESMKSKTPVIVSDLPDLQYLVKEYNIGYVFPGGDSNVLATIIENLPHNKKQYMIFCSNTKKVAKLFTVEESVRRLTTIVKPIK